MENHTEKLDNFSHPFTVVKNLVITRETLPYVVLPAPRARATRKVTEVSSGVYIFFSLEEELQPFKLSLGTYGFSIPLRPGNRTSFVPGRPVTSTVGASYNVAPISLDEAPEFPEKLGQCL